MLGENRFGSDVSEPVGTGRKPAKEESGLLARSGDFSKSISLA
jgi:hypothetical protein